MLLDTNEFYIYHHGVKGQKWGVRRYQNSDGSLTDAGKKRYSNKAARGYYKVQNLQRKQSGVESFKEYQKLGTKINRIQSQLDITTSKLSKADINAGRQRIARNRDLRRMAASALAGTATGAIMIATGAGALGIPIAAGGYTFTRLATGGRYYKKQSQAYK